jgi:hypothetical protein
MTKAVCLNSMPKMETYEPFAVPDAFCSLRRVFNHALRPSSELRNIRIAPRAM